MILHWYLTGTADGRCYTPIKLMLEQIAPSFTLYDVQAVAGIREALASPFSWWGRRELGVINEERGGCWRRLIAAKARLKGMVRWDQQWIDLCLGADIERGRLREGAHATAAGIGPIYWIRDGWLARRKRRGIMCHPDGPDQRNRMKSKKKHKKERVRHSIYITAVTFPFHRSWHN